MKTYATVALLYETLVLIVWQSKQNRNFSTGYHVPKKDKYWDHCLFDNDILFHLKEIASERMRNKTSDTKRTMQKWVQNRKHAPTENI